MSDSFLLLHNEGKSLIDFHDFLYLAPEIWNKPRCTLFQINLDGIWSATGTAYSDDISRVSPISVLRL